MVFPFPMSMVKMLLSRTGWNKTKVTENVDLILLTLTAGFALVCYIVKFKHKPKYCKMLTQILLRFHFGYTFSSLVYLAYRLALVRQLKRRIYLWVINSFQKIKRFDLLLHNMTLPKDESKLFNNSKTFKF